VYTAISSIAAAPRWEVKNDEISRSGTKDGLGGLDLFNINTIKML
jgi:hypothetical protein